jgi:sugar/nucleoside kinase (ribokinase family)
METSARFFCLDTVMIDIVMKVVALPQRGGDAVSSKYLVTPGGGFNSMSAVHRHGITAVYVGRLGRGPFSQLALTELSNEDIGNPVAANDECDIGFCLVLVDEQGERTFVTAPGAEGTLRALDLTALDVRSGDYVFLSGYNFVYPQLGAVIAPWLADLASDVVVALDPGPRVMDIDPNMLTTVLGRVDWLLCNAEEAVQLTGGSTLGGAASALLERTGRRGVVVRDGASGCVVVARGDELLEVEGFSVEVVDTNGAGDIHDGVFLSEIARGTNLKEAARRANAAAAMSIGEFGPANCPARDEVTRWYTQFS